MQEKPKVGHNRNISAEVVLSLQPDLILARTEELNTALRSQFETAGVRVVSYKQEYSAEGTRTLIREVAQSLGQPGRASPIIGRLAKDLKTANRFVDTLSRPRVLFIYERGTGTQIGRAHVCTPVTNAHLVCLLLFPNKHQKRKPKTSV